MSEYQYRVLQPTDAAQQITIVDMKGVGMQVGSSCPIILLIRCRARLSLWKNALV